MSRSSYWNNRKVLVTGHEGFLGSWLTRSLVEMGAKVAAVDKAQDLSNPILKGVRRKFKGYKGNIANLNLMESLIGNFKPQTIFHIAAEAIVGRANKNPIRTFKSNIQGTWNVLEASKNRDFIEAIVVASSDKAYGSHKDLPYKEDAPLQGKHPYDVSKSCADLLCGSYAETFQVPVCVTRCGNIYGPGDFNFSRLVPDAIRHIIKGKQFTIRSDGKYTRDYIFVKDVVSAYLILAQNVKKLKLRGEAFNFSCENPMSVLDFYKEICKISGKEELKPRILNKADFEIKHQYLSSRKAERILRWKPQYNMKKGLKETIDWYSSINK